MNKPKIDIENIDPTDLPSYEEIVELGIADETIAMADVERKKAIRPKRPKRPRRL